jgi:periplasmic divalent cation tolerance protein
MYIVIFVTCPNAKSAEKIAETLLKKKLAACVNMIYAVKSLYSWKGKMEKAHEVLMVIKTREKHFSAISELVDKLHPASIPEIIALPITTGSKHYLEWIKKETK